MSISYIRKTYGVPARIGSRIKYKPPYRKEEIEGTIKGSRGAYLLIQLDGCEGSLPFHPTWNLTYLEGEPDE
jgi:hypothetical protein